MITPFIHPLAKDVYQEWEELTEQAISEFESKKLIKIELSDQFTPRRLVETSDVFLWMKECEFKIISKNNPSNEIVKDEYMMCINSLEELKQYFIDNAVITYDKLKNDKPIIAIDTETTGLSTNYVIKHGKPVYDTEIVGVPIAISDKEGIYIPLKHTGEDGINNWNVEEVRDFVQWLMDNYNLIMHNAQYDVSILTNLGVIIDKDKIIDTMLLSKLQHDYEFQPLNIGHGLKGLSGYKLNRKMLEINEILGLKKKTFIRFDLLPTYNAFTYAISDAINTFALFKHMVLDNKDGRNPYEYQNLSTRVAMKSVYYTCGTINYGLPIDKDFLFKRTKTLIIRIIMLQEKFNQIIEKYNYEHFSISSPLIGNFLVHILKNKWDGDEDNFYKFIEEKLHLKRKLTQLKDRIKEEFSTSDDVLSHILSSIDNTTTFDDVTKSDVKDIINMVSIFRSLNKDKATYIAILHAVRKDERNMWVTPIGLRLLSTDTGRFSNMKGTGGYPEYVAFRQLKTKQKGVIVTANGITKALNAQGMPSTSPKVKSFKKADSITDKMRLLEKEAELIIKKEIAELGA